MDVAILNFVSDIAGRFFLLDLVGVILAEYLPYLLIVLALVFVLTFDSWKERLFTFIFISLGVLISNGVIATILKPIFDRSNPFEVMEFSPLVDQVAGMSFPSDHASFFFALAFCIFLFNRKWGSWFIGLATLNGLARIFAGLHWPTDIIGGAVVGALAFGFVYLLLGKYFDRIMK